MMWPKTPGLRRPNPQWGVGVLIVAAAALSWGALCVPLHPRRDPGLDAAPLAQAELHLGMWAAMVGAMMLPVALPTVLRLRRGRPGNQGGIFVFSMQLLAGWLAVWSAFAVGAAALQISLHRAGWLDAPMGRVEPWLGALLWMGAGAWQLTRWKHRCLKRCDVSGRSREEAAPGEPADAWRMGLLFGVGCVGSCWALMFLMFAGGVMNLWWMGGLTVYLLVERLAAESCRFRRAAGIVLLLTGFVWVPGSEPRERSEWCAAPADLMEDRREAGASPAFSAQLPAGATLGSA